MSQIIKPKTAKIIGVFVAVAMLLGVGAPVANAAELTEAQISSILNLLSSFGADQAVIDDVNSALRGEPTSGSGPSMAASVCPYTWTRDLTTGATGDDVMKLQEFLNADSATMVASSGVGSPGNETSYFGSLTASAVAKFQNKYASDVLAPIGLSSGTGYFGTMSRSKANELCVAAPTAPTAPTAPSEPTAPTAPSEPTTVAPGTGLAVSSGTQPAAGLAPANAARVPFTKVNLTAGTDGAVTVSSIVVELNANADDTDFTDVVLMNEDGTLIGIPKSFGSSDRATIGDSFTIPAGTTKTVVVGGNIAASPTDGVGANIMVTAVNTSATVSGSLPITGATHTLNAGLSIGSVSTLGLGAFNPGADRTVDIGTTDQNFTSVKFTAGSVEDLWVKSIRWKQVGSAGSADAENIRTVVDGVEYETAQNGDFYTTVFPGDGLSIVKGFSKDFTVRGDVVGGSSREIDFDIDRRTDLHVVGKKFGYGITPPFGTATTEGQFQTTNNPWFDGYDWTINSGSMTVSTWTAGAPAQNVAENVVDQPLAAFTVDVKGESITVDSFDFNLNVIKGSGNTGTTNLSDITDVKLVDESGSVIGGPVDGAGTAVTGSVTLSDSYTFPVGLTNVILKGKLSADFENNDAVTASTTPRSDFNNATGDTTGDSISVNPNSLIAGNTMTVKTASVSLTISSQPTSRNVVAGSSGFEFARYIIDANASGEDVRMTTIPLEYNFVTITNTDLTNCKLFDGSTAVTTGSNVVNPSVATGADETFTLDGSGLVIAKGTSKTLSLQCDVSGSAASGGTVTWGLDATLTTFTGFTGVTSGETVTPSSVSEANQPTMTVATSGSYTVTNDTSVLFAMAQAGATGVSLGKLRFEADTVEDINLRQIALQLGSTTLNSPNDLVGQKVELWHDGTKVGEAQFGLSAPDNATSTLTSTVTIARGEIETIEVRGDLLAHNADQGTPGAIVIVEYDGDNNGLNGNYGSGVGSGATINGGTTADVTTKGVQVFRTIPTFEDVTSATALTAGSDLYSIKITAGATRDILVDALAFDIATSGATVTNFQLFGPSGAVASQANAIGDDAVALRVVFDDTNSDRLITKGTAKTYRLRANTVVFSGSGTDQLNVNLRADAAHATTSIGVGTILMDTVAGLGTSLTATANNNNVVWSPNSTTTPEATAAKDNNLDWTNSYGAPGFPGVGQDMQVRVFTHAN